MDPNQNTGSFGQGLGGTDALKQALSRRGIDSSILDQITPASGGASPVAQGIPQTNPNIGTTDQQVASQAVPGIPTATIPKIPFRSAEMEIATKAMSGIINTENEIVKQTLKLQGLG
jgi:hypothetical protein